MDNLILDGGLDLVRARPAALPGLIRECLNYEVGWRRGYTRIDGFERFDGHISPSNTTGWVFSLLDTDIVGTFSAPEDLVWVNASTGAVGPSGVLVQTEPFSGQLRLWVSFRSGQRRPQLGDLIRGVDSGAEFFVGLINPNGVQTYPEYYETHGPYLDGLDEMATILRNEIKEVPGGGTIVGLHYHEDKLYAIRDVANATVPVGSENTLVVGMYVENQRGQIGEVVSVDAVSRIVNIAAVYDDGFYLEAADVITILLTFRFNTGLGEFNRDDGVTIAGVADWIGTVAVVEARDGSFESGNALGTAAFSPVPGAAAVADASVVTNDTVGGSTMVVESVMFVDEADAVTVESVSSQSDVAALWSSSPDGWEGVKLGRFLPFYDGMVDPAGTGVINATKTLTAGDAAFLYSSGSSSPDWTTPYSNILIDDANKITSNPYIDGFYNIRSSDWLGVSEFDVGLLDGDVITGMEFILKGVNLSVPSSTFCNFQVMLLDATPTPAGTFSVDVPYPALDVVSAGGAGAMWGRPNITPAAVNLSSFGFQFKASMNLIGASPATVDLNYVEFKIYYDTPKGEKLYIWDVGGAGDVGYVTISEAVVTSGAWGGPDPTPGYAEGYFRLTDWSVVEVTAGSELYLLPGGPGPGNQIVATLGGSIGSPTLPGSLQLDENVSKYEMISYNFFASEEQNAIYGVNGAGLAFWYDGTTLDFIPTGVELDVDKPRHIAPHENRLALGYKWGEVYLSGTDPLNFDSATSLAASFGFGDKITGLMPAPGKALAVFTESSTNVLLGAPESFGGEALSGTVEQRIINHKVGAIEYTVQNVGNSPIFASFRGIETLETMDQYSDFFTAPLTDKVSSWLLERLQTAAGVEAVNKAVVNSVVVRNKNQYRLFFADGYVLTLTLVGPEKEPQLTTQQYWFQDDRTKYARVFATASGVTTDGRDRAFFSVEERIGGLGESPIGDNLDFVYELDRGRSFDGNEIEANFSLTYYYGQGEQGGPDPMHSKRYNAFHLHGVAAGTADLYMTRTVNYEYINPYVAEPAVPVPYESIPFYHSTLPAQEQPRAKYTKGRLTARGFAVSMQVSHKSKLEFPHTIQMISFVNESKRKQDV